MLLISVRLVEVAVGVAPALSFCAVGALGGSASALRQSHSLPSPNAFRGPGLKPWPVAVGSASLPPVDGVGFASPRCLSSSLHFTSLHFSPMPTANAESAVSLVGLEAEPTATGLIFSRGTTGKCRVPGGRGPAEGRGHSLPEPEKPGNQLCLQVLGERLAEGSRSPKSTAAGYGSRAQKSRQSPAFSYCGIRATSSCGTRDRGRRPRAA